MIAKLKRHRIAVLRPGDLIISSADLHERLGHTYRDGFKDGRDNRPFSRGWWLSNESRAAMNERSCAHPAACGPICGCDRCECDRPADAA